MSKPDLGIMYGDEGLKNTKKLLHKFGAAERLVWSGARVGIKPNLVLPSPAEKGATTDPEIVAGIIEYIKNYSPAEITIMEGSWVGSETEQAFQTCGYVDLAEKYGVKLKNLKNDGIQTLSGGKDVYKICAGVLEQDILINVPVLKAHCQTKLTCAVKNLKGCIPDSEKRRFHREGLHRPIAALDQIIQTDLVVVDGIYGDLTFEEGGNPVKMNRIIAGLDPVLVDSYAARLMALEPGDVGYLKRAAAKRGVDTSLSEAHVQEFNTPVDQVSLRENSSRLAAELSDKYINGKAACSACYGNLIYALYRLKSNGALNSFSDKIYIGQDYRGQKMEGPGIGSCTAEFSRNLEGCPPEACEIMEFLKNDVL